MKIISLFFLCILYLILPNNLSSQILWNDAGLIPPDYRVDWTVAGLLNDLGPADHIVDITSVLGDNDTEKLKNAIIEAQNNCGVTIIYIPAGRYYITERINITPTLSDGIVFKGDGINTYLIFKNYNLDFQSCFYIRGSQTKIQTNLTTALLKDSTNITVNNISGFKKGDWVRISEYDFPYVENDFKGCVGQITQIIDISYKDNQATIKDKASKTYLSNNNLKMWKIKPIKNIGFENIKIKRDGYLSAHNCSNFDFRYAVNCWVKGVESYSTFHHHVDIKYSSHLSVSGNYFHDASEYGGGGYGYGVVLNLNTTNCAVENNIFKNLRHAMTIQGGANCNVFLYNYSRDQHWDHGEPGPDLCIHGNYPFANLFEQNYVENIEADTPHRPSGPYNSLIRNIVIDDPECNWSTIVLNDVPNTAVLGCEVSSALGSGGVYSYGSTSFSVEMYGHFSVYGFFNHLDKEQIAVDWELFYLKDVSYYYSSRPNFVNSNYTFPSIGPKRTLSEPATTQSNPARGRYYGRKKTYIENLTEMISNRVSPSNRNTISISGVTTFTIENSSYCDSLPWSVSVNANWVTITPTSGTLGAGQSQTLTVNYNSNPNNTDRNCAITVLCFNQPNQVTVKQYRQPTTSAKSY